MDLFPQNNPVLVIALAQNMASAIQKLEFAIAMSHIMEKNVIVSFLSFWIQEYILEIIGNLKLMYLVAQNNPVLVIALAQNMASAIQKLEFAIVMSHIMEKNVIVSLSPFWIHEYLIETVDFFYD